MATGTTYKIQLRRGTAAEWTTANPVLGSGEPGFETDTGLIKIGDGTKTWTALSYTNVNVSYAPINSPVFVGNPTAPTPPVDDNDTSIATSAFVIGQAYDGVMGSDIAATTPGVSKRWARGDHRHPPDPTIQFLPIGSIIMYGGSTAPDSKWHLCDGSAHGSAALQAIIGSANTPDLRNRFVVGAGSTYAQASTGGATTHVHDGSTLYAKIYSSAAVINQLRSATPPAWNMSHTVTGASGTTGSGSVAAGTAVDGNTGSASSLPPYYALTYLIKKA
jgi:hypothetical protein